MMHPEEGLNVVPTGRPRQILLEGQKGGTLGEEDREGRTGGIEQGILAIVAGLPAVRKSQEGRCNLGDKPWALRGMAFGLGFEIRKVSMPKECLKTLAASRVF